MANNESTGDNVIETGSRVAIERLLSLVSHELRTPMTSLKGAIELLQSCSPQDSKDIESLLLLAASNTDRLGRVIETILDWSQIIYEEAPLFKQPCQGEQVLRDVVAELTPLAAGQQIDIKLAITDPLPLFADSYFLNRALRCVVDNAIKFSPLGSQVILLTTCVSSIESRAVGRAALPLPFGLIAVQDQGPGIPEEFIEEIFQPFLQVDVSDSRSHQGLGLELAICRQIIQRHGGRIWAESTLGEGSTFYIALPLET